jgi:hypothetical protein
MGGLIKKVVLNVLQVCTALNKRLKPQRENKVNARALSLLCMAKMVKYNVKTAMVMILETLKGKELL